MTRKKYYTTREAAEFLGFNDDSYIRRLIIRGKLTSTKLTNRQHVISRNDLDNFLIRKRLDAVEQHILKHPDL